MHQKRLQVRYLILITKYKLIKFMQLRSLAEQVFSTFAFMNYFSNFV